MNLAEGLFSEMNRVREVIKIYESVGSAGTFASGMMKVSISNAEASMLSGDIVEMLKAYNDLKSWEA